jgi:hypothetical protein
MSAGGADPASSEELDRIGQRYAELLDESFAVSHDAVAEAVAEARAAGAREARKKGAKTGPARPRPAGPTVADTRAVDLVRIAVGRGVRRLRPRR